MEIWLQYQALMFGFYYALFEALASCEMVQPDSYLYPPWHVRLACHTQPHPVILVVETCIRG
jgi:hypothetical protein